MRHSDREKRSILRAFDFNKADAATFKMTVEDFEGYFNDNSVINEVVVLNKLGLNYDQVKAIAGEEFFLLQDVISRLAVKAEQVGRLVSQVENVPAFVERLKGAGIHSEFNMNILEDEASKGIDWRTKATRPVNGLGVSI